MLQELNPAGLRLAVAEDILRDYKGGTPEQFRKYIIEGRPREQSKVDRQSELFISRARSQQQQPAAPRKLDYLSKKKQQIDQSLALLKELREREKNKPANQERLKADRQSAEQDLLQGAQHLKLHATGIRDHLKDDEGKLSQLKQDQERSKLSLDKENQRLKEFAKSKGIGFCERMLTFLVALVVFFLGMNLIFWFPMRTRGS